MAGSGEGAVFPPFYLIVGRDNHFLPLHFWFHPARLVLTGFACGIKELLMIGLAN